MFALVTEVQTCSLPILTHAFDRSSVALFTLVIPEQDLSGGIVTVASAEGYVGSVTLSGERESGPAPLVARMASSLAGRRPLPRARFERALGNIADLPGVTVTTTLALGRAQGAVAIDLALDRKSVV